MNSSDPLEKAIKFLDTFNNKCIFIVDEVDKLVGTISNHEIRLALLNGLKSSSEVRNCMNTKFIYAYQTSSHTELISLSRKFGINEIPIVTSEMKFVRVWEKNNLTIPVWILAGGEGKRMGFLTSDKPKPLLEINSKPILGYIIDQFLEQGFNNINFSVGFKANTVKKWIESNYSKSTLSISFIEDPSELKLETAGFLEYLNSDIDNIIVQNGDVLTNVDYLKLYDFHVQNKNHITVCLTEFKQEIPFGVVKTKDNQIVDIIEKPNYRFLVNAGIYIISNPKFLHEKGGKKWKMTDLIQELVTRNYRVGSYILDNSWIDIGTPEKLELANSYLKEKNDEK